MEGSDVSHKLLHTVSPALLVADDLCLTNLGFTTLGDRLRLRAFLFYCSIPRDEVPGVQPFQLQYSSSNKQPCARAPHATHAVHRIFDPEATKTALNNTDRETRIKIIYIVKNNNNDKEKVKWVIKKVVEAGGIAYATDKMNEYKREALAILHQFPGSPVRQGLEDMVLFVTDRKY